MEGGKKRSLSFARKEGIQLESGGVIIGRREEDLELPKKDGFHELVESINALKVGDTKVEERGKNPLHRLRAERSAQAFEIRNAQRYVERVERNSHV